ncbi:MAG: hypothetical protein AAF772_10365 [Acidobacteriota bacterium]
MAKYPLAALKKHRERQVDEAKEALALRMRDHAQAEEEVTRQKQKLQSLIDWQEKARREAFEQACSGTFQIDTANQMTSAVDAIKYQIEAQHDVIKKAEQAVETAAQAVAQARTALNEATRAVEAVEKHYEKWKESIRLAKMREEEKRREEVATAAWVRQSLAGAS